MKATTSYSEKLRYMIATAMFSALALVCSIIIPHIKVMFLTFDIKDALITIGALSFGPVTGLVSSLLVALLEMLLISDTGIYGMIMNFLSSAAMSVTAALIYRRLRSYKGAVISLVASVFSVVCVMMLANIFITPFYMKVPRSAVIQLLPTLLLPFNAIKATTNASLTMFLYKPMMNALSHTRLIEAPVSASHADKKTVASAVISGAIVVGCILIFFFVLSGRWDFIWNKS